ncbi:MAG TPA: hypothetical protein DCX52_13925 [Massilia sp.]|nr:hypothetical protein [Massilia sp.]
MTAAAIRIPRRLVRKLAKPALLWLNAWRFQQSMFELGRLQAAGNARAAARESRHQVKLQLQRRRINGW